MIANIIQTIELETNYLDKDIPWKGILSTTAFAVSSTYHTALKKMPGQLVLGCVTIFNIQHDAKWVFIRKNKQVCINKNSRVESAKHVAHLYKEGNHVLLQRGTENKYETPYQGPFSILKVHDNGTVYPRVGAIEDTYNIRRLAPYTFAPTKADVVNHGEEYSLQKLIPRKSARKHPPRAYYRPC